ncbi:Uncharacterised protein [Actinobaculum suis]|uniref:Uncharacterized protein n=1 Tax=Actinobaculum suis TaxID=1657 RepID=A0A7Z8YAU6_9ACTO|nr:hypothetical protein [Actinobaculum suis]VDG76910.1 Uncharacterised protein [Actinobaculum suis]
MAEAVSNQINDFSQSITMAELALFEALTGEELGNADTATTVAGMAAVAAHRLGHSLTLEDAQSLSMKDVTSVIDAAAGVHCAHTDAASNLMAAIAGK